jgi:hypothetical protein
MNKYYLQLVVLTIFARIISVRYAFSVIKGVRPVLILKKEKVFFQRLVEAVPVMAVTLTTLLILQEKNC